MAVTVYTIIAKRDLSTFVTAVQTRITAGDQPIGGPFQDESGTYIQAVSTGSQVFVGATGDTGSTGAAGDTLTNPPIVTTTERDLLTPAEGDVVYNSTTKKINFYNGTAWAAVTSV